MVARNGGGPFRSLSSSAFDTASAVPAPGVTSGTGTCRCSDHVTRSVDSQISRSPPSFRVAMREKLSPSGLRTMNGSRTPCFDVSTGRPPLRSSRRDWSSPLTAKCTSWPVM